MRAITHPLWPGYSWKKQVKVSDLLISSSGKIISREDFYVLLLLLNQKSRVKKGSSRIYPLFLVNVLLQARYNYLYIKEYADRNSETCVNNVKIKSSCTQISTFS